MKLELVGRLMKPTADAVTAALELIREEQGKIRYDVKEKWLKFQVGDNEILDERKALEFLKTVKQRLAAEHRRSYGNSRSFRAIVIGEEGVAVLYVHVDDNY